MNEQEGDDRVPEGAVRADGLGDVTQALRRLRAGEVGADEQLMRLVHAHLRRIAGSQLRRESGDRDLEANDLMHEAWLRLFGGETPELADRRHLYRAFARAARRVLVDHARKRDAAKRGGGRRRVTLSGLRDAEAESSVDILALNQALERLEAIGGRRARIVELRFFAGLSVPEIAETLGIGISTVQRDWAVARAWLQAELSG
jgi:RNA polymerase sigma factor (TIGR02999 family)